MLLFMAAFFVKEIEKNSIALENIHPNGTKIKDITSFKEKLLQTSLLNSIKNNLSNKIFIIGSSQIKSLNTTHIHNYLHQNGHYYDVYNFGKAANTPNENLDLLTPILNNNPEFVVYGISYRDFMEKDSTSNFLRETIRLLNFDLISTHYDFLKNPKFSTLSLIKNNIFQIKDVSEPKKKLFFPYPNSTFTISKDNMNIKNEQELKNHFLVHGATFKNLGDFTSNSKIMNFIEFINTLQKNNVKIILFTTPQHSNYINAMPDLSKNEFKELLIFLSNNLNTTIYSFDEKYVDNSIWNDPTHIAINQTGIIYSNDIGRIILENLES
jgi:hypothetical protein